LDAPDALSQRYHFERSAAVVIDTSLTLIPVYGSAAVLGWTVGSFIASLLMPNALAASITSSPGSTITFLVEYFFSGTIPSSIAQDAFRHAAGSVITLAEGMNTIQKRPSVPVLP